VATQITDARRRASQREAVDLLTIPATAERLGCSDNHVYRLVAAGQLRAVDIAPPGNQRTKTRVRSDDLAAYIESRTRVVPAAGGQSSSR
jgi:excisionase family DNA binding protein